MMASRMITTAWSPPTSNTNNRLRLLGSGAGKGCSFIERKVPVAGRVSAAMANAAQDKELRKPRPQNVAGEFYVDETCINCDTCSWMAPSCFAEAENKAAVYKQPTTKEERVQALQALISCPSRSIQTMTPPPDIQQVHKTLPIPIDDVNIPGVYHCGHHSEKGHGATSYLLVHPQGNILIDSPNYSTELRRNIEAMGGVRYMFLTHRHLVADHQEWAEALNCERIIHSLEVQETTAGVEMKLEGEGPWKLYDDVDVIFTPGHSQGSVCLLHKKVLFSGDHLVKMGNDLSIGEYYNYYSVSEQLKNVKLLLDVDFLWLLPGHRRRVSFKDLDEKNSALKAFLESKYFAD